MSSTFDNVYLTPPAYAPPTFTHPAFKPFTKNDVYKAFDVPPAFAPKVTPATVVPHKNVDAAAQAITDGLGELLVDDRARAFGKAIAQRLVDAKLIDTTPAPPITVHEALRTLAEVVNAQGADYVYPDELKYAGNPNATCQYIADGKPACIVGKVLAKLGRLDNDVVAENRGADAFARAGVATRDAARVLRAAQVEQDQGKTWGHALGAAYAAAIRDGLI